jgi:hypothetical protein
MVRRTTFVPFRRFLGDVRQKFMQSISAAPWYWVTIFAMLCMRAVPLLWHVSMFVGLIGRSGFSSFCVSSFVFYWWFSMFFLVRNSLYCNSQLMEYVRVTVNVRVPAGGRVTSSSARNRARRFPIECVVSSSRFDLQQHAQQTSDPYPI